MKQTLQLKTSQQLTLSPQLQQALRLLQLSTLELNQEVEQMLQENPLLERAESEAASYAPSPNDPYAAPSSQNTAEPSPSSDEGRAERDGSEDAGENRDDLSRQDAGSEADWGSEIRSKTPRDPNDEDADLADQHKAEITLREHLGAQLGLMQLSDHDRGMAIFLVEALNEDGYLAQPLEDLVDVLADCLPTSDSQKDSDEALDLLEELHIALRRLQSLDPPGIGARTPSECLSLQLENQPASSERDLALRLVEPSHLELLAARDFTQLKRLLKCTDDALRSAHARVRSLNPRPGAQYAPLDTRYIIPDVIIRKHRGRWIASLNQAAMPQLRVNQMYASILSQHRGAHSSMAGQLQEARALIRNIKQRFDTILRTAQAIADRQTAFLDHGEVAMRPLTLREIAETLELHESTISRVTTQKYMATPRGIFEFKYFFGSHVATDTGGAASSTAIRALIKKIIESENGHKPLSDAKIAELLGEQGIVVARRTVAKYREALNIPPVNLRKLL